MANKKRFFTEQLLNWFNQNDRPMPWKGEKNPYLVWLSEIILQQTRVEQGLPYFERFKEKYPTIQDLANAPEDEVMKLWEGLGYYSRARNLHFTAKHIANELHGEFPNTYKSILKLKGVGPYTAAAIASFAFGLPYAVVDGNVFRVLSRFFGIDTPIDTTEGKKQFTVLANELLDETQAGIYNQAIMDFGAVHCTPKSPNCQNCLMQSQCAAFQENKVSSLPIKSKTITKKERYFHYLVLNFPNGDTLIQKRTAKDIWQKLYEFPLIEISQFSTERQIILEHDIWQNHLGISDFSFIKKSQPYKQVLTHRKVIAIFWEIQVNQATFSKADHFVRVNRKNLFKFAFPKLIDRYLQNKSLSLDL